MMGEPGSQVHFYVKQAPQLAIRPGSDTSHRPKGLS